MNSLTIEQLKTVFDSGGVSSVTLFAQGSEFFLRIATKNEEVVLARARSKTPRSFPNPLVPITLMRKIGIVVGSFDVSNWNPDQKSITRARPDRAKAMKHVHEVAEHDKWFRAQVENALAEADDPLAEWVTNEEANTKWAKKRAELENQISGAI